MSGKILSAARNDLRKFSSSGGFEEEITLKNPDGSIVLVFKNFHVKHNMAFDSDGARISSESATIGINATFLDEENYPYKNSKTGRVDLKGHRVEVNDFATVQKYVINESYPSKTFGHIVCVLGESE